MTLQLAQIVPPAPRGSGVTPTRGTKVVLPDGSTLNGVTRIEITGQVNDVWRARIDCMVELVLMPGMLIDVRQAPGERLNLWRRALLRLAGVSHLDMTAMDDAARAYRALDLWKPRNAQQDADPSAATTTHAYAQHAAEELPAGEAGTGDEQRNVAEDPSRSPAA